MFTQKLTAWREKQRPETAWFQGKIQVEKSGGNLGHIHRVTPATTPLTTGRIIGRRSTFSLQSQCFHEVLAHSENSAPLSGRTVGSAVGNPGEQGGEQGGEPRGAGWGTPGSGVGSTVEERRAVHATARRERGKPTHKALRQHTDNSSPPHSLLTHVTVVRHDTNDTAKHRTIHTWLCPLMHIRAILGIRVGGFA